MRVSQQWLRDWVSIDGSIDDLSSALTMAGLEVDSIIPVASPFSGVVVGYIESCDQHPNADRLRCCRVNLGAEVVDIVCGGKNVKAQQKVAVATVGACLGSDFKIKRTKLRGEPSCGMICSSQELGLGDDGSGGIMELPEDAPIGQCLREYLQLDDVVLDVDLTPNRGDCLSMLGIAREVASSQNQTLTPVESAKNTISIDQQQSIDVRAHQACPRYVGRIITGIPKHRSTPLWMIERLRRAGIRAIDPVVDVLNYVMLELGQPMHAFDLDKISGSIAVRYAESGEKLELLDNQTIELSEHDLIICDKQKPLALAGVMGGLDSAVTDKTSSIFLESAYFEPIGVAKTARKYGLQTDSSYRFARDVDYLIQESALERATSLLSEVLGDIQIGPLTTECQASYLPQRNSIELRLKRVERVLGVVIPPAVIQKLLQAIGMTVSLSETTCTVVSPSFRSDISTEIELIEEIARLYGYSAIPTNEQSVSLSFPKTINVTDQHQIKRAIAVQGYQEVVNYSFIDHASADAFANGLELMSLDNPLSNDLSTMRPSLWPGLLKTLQYNLHRQCSRQALFEVGCCFSISNAKLSQSSRVAMLLSGYSHPEQWGQSKRLVDFYDIKGHVDALLASARHKVSWQWQKAENACLHPGQSVGLFEGDQLLGHLGALHPSLAQELNISVPVFLFEADLAFLQCSDIPQVEHVSKFPSVRRDLSFIINSNVMSSDMIKIIRQCDIQILDKVNIFDVYCGDECGIGKKSIAIGLTFQAASRTLVDEEINQVIDIIIKALQSGLDATLRV